MSANIYELGNVVILSAQFVASRPTVPADPSSIKCRVLDPTGTEKYYVGGQLTRTGVGAYYVPVLPTIVGTWSYRWEGTGAVVAAHDNTFIVSSSSFVLDYVPIPPNAAGIYDGSYTVALLPAGVEGNTAYATNGRKVSEAAGHGTGVYVYYSNGAWRVLTTDQPVSS